MNEIEDTSDVSGGPPSGLGSGCVRVWLVDDHAPERERFSQLLNQRDGIICTRTFATGAEILATLEEERPPDVLLLEVTLDDETGLDLIRPLRKLAPTAKVLMFTTFRHAYFATDALRAGASGFLLKSWDVNDLERCIRLAKAGHQPSAPGAGTEPPTTAEVVAQRPPSSPLTAVSQFFRAMGSRLGQ